MLTLLAGCSGKRDKDDDSGDAGYVPPLTDTQYGTGYGSGGGYQSGSGRPSTDYSAQAVGRARVRELESTKAKFDRWFLNAESGTRIRSRAAMFEAIKPLHSGRDPALETLAFLYQSASVVCTFRFEGNYNAMVFFDESDNPIHVEKW